MHGNSNIKFGNVPKSFVKHIDTIYNNTCSRVIPASVPDLLLDSIPLVRISDLDNPEAIKNTKVDQICLPW
jgi:hypothetical protein